MATAKNNKQALELLRKRLKHQPKKNIKRAIARATSNVYGDIVSNIQRGKKTGKTTNKYNPKRTHTASAPGEFPATDTGFLVANITTSVFSKPNGEVVGQIVSAAPYSKYLEFGTTNMQPRPFMQKGLEMNRRKIDNIFKQEGLVD